MLKGTATLSLSPCGVLIQALSPCAGQLGLKPPVGAEPPSVSPRPVTKLDRALATMVPAMGLGFHMGREQQGPRGKREPGCDRVTERISVARGWVCPRWWRVSSEKAWESNPEQRVAEDVRGRGMSGAVPGRRQSLGPSDSARPKGLAFIVRSPAWSLTSPPGLIPEATACAPAR